ncbi:MAG: MCE family protein, partial [Nocardioides sp.]
MTRASRIRLLVFLLVGGLAVVNAGARYAGLTERLFPSSYAVTVHLADSGGLFERGEVTYRGVTVGRVQSLDFRTDGVDAVLAIEDGARIPADVEAEVHNRSAVGEQYLDLVPRDDHGPYLADGSVVDVADTSTPIPTERLVLTVDRLLRSVDTGDLRTVVDESGQAFDGAGPDLGRLLGNSRTVVDVARQALPATRALLRSAHTVLLTQAQQAGLVTAYLRDLDGVTRVVALRDPALRKV